MPGATEEKKGRALGKGNAVEKQVLTAGDATTGDTSLVTVKLLPDAAKRGQLKAAAARIQDGELHAYQGDLCCTHLVCFLHPPLLQEA